MIQCISLQCHFQGIARYLTGDGLCCYIKPESIDLALKILDGYVLDGHTLKVERAKFTLKGDFDPKKRKRRKLTNKEKNAFREKQVFFGQLGE